MSIHRVERVFNGKTLVIETGKIAKQAGGAVTVQIDNTLVFVAVTSAPLPADKQGDLDFFPLTVDYREKTYAAGKFPGGFFKREGRPSTKETLTMRLMDRPIRPLFPAGYKADVSIQAMVLSTDLMSWDTDVLSLIGASASLAISDIPTVSPIAGVRVGYIENNFVLNPSAADMTLSALDLVVAGTKDAVCMVESSAKELPEDTIVEAIKYAHGYIKEIIAMQEELVALVKPVKQTFTAPDYSEGINVLRTLAGTELKTRVRTEGKMARAHAVKEFRDQILPQALEKLGGQEKGYSIELLKGLFDEVRSEVIRKMIIEEQVREDGRGLDEIREITGEVAILPMAHGSCLFTRGETQALASVTLGSTQDGQLVDGLGDSYTEKFMLHYNFPSFCVGETWPNRGPKRREIGHGQLALRAIQAVLPKEEVFPYTIRIVSDIMESNGSSSMATVCGATLSLMDAGVPITAPVAGIAMGMVTEGDKAFVLTDILGDEDHCGDMDFKVAGSSKGITALQMDIKTHGIQPETMKLALSKARPGIDFILGKIQGILSEPREKIAEHAPRITIIKIDPDKIGKVIGPGGKTIRAICEETKATIDIQDDGTVTISAVGSEPMEKATKAVEALVETPKVGKIYEGTVRAIKDFGAFVEICPGIDGLVHISELSDTFVKDISEVVKVGDKMTVKVILIDDQGRIKLSKKQAESKKD